MDVSLEAKQAAVNEIAEIFDAMEARPKVKETAKAALRHAIRVMNDRQATTPAQPERGGDEPSASAPKAAAEAVADFLKKWSRSGALRWEDDRDRFLASARAMISTAEQEGRA